MGLPVRGFPLAILLGLALWALLLLIVLAIFAGVDG
jgi:hypothetical protein